METLIIIDICIFVGLILILVSLSVSKFIEKDEKKIRYLHWLTNWCIIMLFTEIVSSKILITGDSKYVQIATILYTLLLTFIMFYGYIQITLLYKSLFHKVRVSKKIKLLHLLPTIITAVALIYNLKTNLFFRITDTLEVYTYTTFYLFIALGALMVILSLIYMFINIKSLNKNEIFLVQFITFAPVIGLITQKSLLGKPALIPVLCLNVVAIYLMQLTKERKKDLLTQLINLEYFKTILDNLENHNNFTLVLIDLSNISKIVTKYGKSEADYIIKHFAKTARNSLSFDATICRKYEDEFYILFEQKTEKEIQEELLKLENAVKNLNMKLGELYSISYNYSVSKFDIDKFKNVPDFLKYLDHLLYIKKNAV